MDMGGTSFDVSLIAGGAADAHHRVRDRVGPARSYTPMVDVTRSAPAAARSPGSTRAACCASGRAAPGPTPGPACYGRGGTRGDGDRRQRGARAASTPTTSSAARCRSTRRPRAPPSSGWATALGMTLEDVAASVVELVDFNMVERDPAGLDRPRSRSARLHARRRSAAPARCTPARWPRSSARATCSSRCTRACSRRSALMTADMRVDESLTASLRSDRDRPRARQRRASTGCAQRASPASQPRATTARRCSRRPSRCATSARTTARRPARAGRPG